MAGMTPPGAGDLNRRIALREWSDVPNAAFGLDDLYAAPVMRWAKHEPVGLAVYLGAQQTDSGITDRWIVRRTEGVTDPASITMRHVIESGGQRYRVRRCSDLGGLRTHTVIETELLGPAS